jgi:hypothetical protein
MAHDETFTTSWPLLIILVCLPVQRFVSITITVVWLFLGSSCAALVGDRYFRLEGFINRGVTDAQDLYSYGIKYAYTHNKHDIRMHRERGREQYFAMPCHAHREMGDGG